MNKILNDKLQYIAALLIEDMELKFPIKVNFTPDDKYMGAHYDEFRITKKGNFKPFHNIILSIPHHKTDNDYLDTFSHEMIHAWQSENGLKRNHGKEFNDWVKYISESYNLYAGKAVTK